MKDLKDLRFDATFEAFHLLMSFLREFAPDSQLSRTQADAIHKHADLIARSLTKPHFVYYPRRDEQGNYIPPDRRKPVARQ